MIWHAGVTFLFPTFLYFLPLSAIPFIIHLLGERKHRPYAFSSLKFLREIEQDSMKKLKWRQWLILLTRALTIAMLILALARPLFRGAWGLAESGILLIDRSFSTQTDPQFREKSNELLQTFEGWQVYAFDEHSSADSLRRKIVDHKMTYRLAEMPLILLSDFQDNAQTAEICAMLEDIDLDIYLLSLPKALANLAVSGLRVLPEYREDGLMSLAIRTSASERYRSPAAVRIRIDGRAAGQVNMDEQGFGIFRFDPGDAERIRCVVQCGEDAYPEDNIRYLVVKPYSDVRILDVSKPENAGYQREALSAMEGIQLIKIVPEYLSAQDLNAFDMLIIDDPGDLPPGQLERILLYSNANPALFIAGEKTDSWLKAKWEKQQVKPGYVSLAFPSAPKETFRIREYYRTDVKPVETLWRLSGGDPLLLRLEGRRYLLLSPFIFENNDMGLSPYFTRILRDFIRTVLQTESPNYETGDLLEPDRPRFTVRNPGGEVLQVQGPFHETQMPGFYILESEDLYEELAVNIPAAETIQGQKPLSGCSGTLAETEDFSVLRDRIRGREASALFFVLAAAFLLFEMLLTGKGEATASWKRS